MAHLAALGGTPVRTRSFPKWPEFGPPEEAALRRALHGPYWGLFGRGEIERFQQRFAACQQTRYAVAVANGTVALRMALLAAGIAAGDEVIVPPYTFIATASAVVECNATPVFADVEPDTFNLDPAAVAAAITPRTRAIIPVHMGGLPADMDALAEIARRHDLVLIEDAAHAHAAEYKGRRTGSLGHLGCFSFQSSKNLTCGEGGAVLTSDAALHESVRSIANCGRRPEGPWYAHHVISGNYRITEFQAALLNAQLDRLEEQAQRRERNARALTLRLAQIPGIRPQALPPYPVRHAYHLYLLRYDPDVFGAPRAAFLSALKAEGIPASEGYPVPLYEQPLFTNRAFGPYSSCLASRPGFRYADVACPGSARLCRTEGVWLYQSLLLGPPEDMDDIANAFEKLYNHRGELATLARQLDGQQA